MGECSGFSLHFESPIVLLSMPIASLLLCEWILSTTGNFTHSIKGKSSIPSQCRKKCGASRFSCWASHFSLSLVWWARAQTSSLSTKWKKSQLRLAHGKQNLRAACLKGKLEFKFFWALLSCSRCYRLQPLMSALTASVKPC